MSSLSSVVYIFLHLDTVLTSVVHQFGPWSYVILFLVLFCETGLVVTPFLPGDSLIFAVGALAAVGGFNLWTVFIVLALAAILGDTTNYWIGERLGLAFFNRPGKKPLIDPKYLERTKGFFERYGKKTILFARFVPIVRTIAPFAAGVAEMGYGHFIAFNIVGGLAWVSLFLFGGYFFGNLPIVRQEFTLVILGIIVISFVPAVITWMQERARPIEPPKA